MKVYLVGAGMGTIDTLTGAGLQAVERAARIICAPRLLEPWAHKPCVPAIDPVEIAGLVEKTAGTVTVLLSGDVGFYSGCTKLLPLLSAYEVEIIPGISSLSYFCAKTGKVWQDAFLTSAHGRSHNAVGEIGRHEKTFVLTGGDCRAQDLCKALALAGLGGIQITVGERLGQSEERIVSGSAEELAEQEFHSLAVLWAENPTPLVRPYGAPSLPDSAFQRGEVPMTKEEVRMLAISKLRLGESHVVWDVGVGTGSVSVELALACCAGRVYAVEKNPVALALLEENKGRFGVYNLEIISGEAPEALQNLPAPDRVFFGGSGGQLEACVKLALEKNPALRLVIAAVTLETLEEAVRLCKSLNLHCVDMVQVAITRTRTAGSYHLMDGQNPVWLISGEGRE